MPPPKDVRVDVTISATQVNEQGQRTPLVPTIVIKPRPGGMVVDVDWSCAQGATAAEPPSSKRSEQQRAPDAAQVVQQAQEWLDARIRQWSGNA